LRGASGNIALLHNLLIDFAASWSDIPERMGWGEDRRVAMHTLRGTAATLGMDEVASAAADLEGGGENVERLRVALAVVLPGLSSLPTPACEARPAEEFGPLIRELEGLLASQDFQATERFQVLRSSLISGPRDADLEQLAREVDGLNFPSAQKSLRAVKDLLSTPADGWR